MTRVATVTRTTLETSVSCRLDLDGHGAIEVATGLGFLDHMIGALAKHGGLDLTLNATGDVHVDDHHTVEDCGLVLGQALLEAVGDRRGIRRFGHAYAPLDEALARAVIDLSGRPWCEVHVPFVRPAIGGVASESLVHFLQSFAIAGRMNLHVDLIRGVNDHHKFEAAFKATALALREAVRQTGDAAVPSTKGVLS